MKRNAKRRKSLQHLYFMLQRPIPLRCKIGISNCPDMRKDQVARDMWLLFSVQIVGAEFWEGVLHVLFRPFHAPVHGNGGTEFFWTIPVIFFAPFFIAAIWLFQFGLLVAVISGMIWFAIRY